MGIGLSIGSDIAEEAFEKLGKSLLKKVGMRLGGKYTIQLKGQTYNVYKESDDDFFSVEDAPLVFSSYSFKEALYFIQKDMRKKPRRKPCKKE